MTRNEQIGGAIAGCGCIAGFAAIGVLAGVVLYRVDSATPPVVEDVPVAEDEPVRQDDVRVVDAGPESEVVPPRPVSDHFTVGQRFRGQMDCDGQEPGSLELRVVLASDAWAVVHLVVVEYPRTETGERTSTRLDHRLEGDVEGRTMRVHYTQTVQGSYRGPRYEVVVTLDATGRVITGTTTRAGCRTLAGTLVQ